MATIINEFVKDGNYLYLDLGDDLEAVYTVAIDNEQTWHLRQYFPNEVELGLSEDYLYFNTNYHSRELISIRDIVAAYNDAHIDACGNSDFKEATILANVYIAEVYDENDNNDFGYIINWKVFYNFLMSLFNQCNCEKCQPPLELITTILAYYEMDLCLKFDNVERFLKIWLKTLRSIYRTHKKECGCK